MPPKKKQEGIASLIGKKIKMECVYDDDALTGTLVSVDDSYLGVQMEDRRVYYFLKSIIRAVSETVVTNE